MNHVVYANDIKFNPIKSACIVFIPKIISSIVLMIDCTTIF